MTYFTVDPEQQKEDAAKRLDLAVEAFMKALERHEEDIDDVERWNAFQAARQVLNDCIAQAQEWTRG